MNFVHRWWRFVRDPQHAGAVVAIFTIVLAVTGAIYTTFSILQWKVMRQTMMNSEKAFMYAEDAFIVGDGALPGTQDIPAKVVVTLGNSGESPARNVVARISSCTRPGNLPKGFGYPNYVANTPTLIGPKQHFQLPMDLPSDVLPDIETNKRHMVVYGEVSYLDIFDQPHRTEFCKAYGGYMLKLDRTAIEKHWFNDCSQHNCYDDDCPKTWGTADCSAP